MQDHAIAEGDPPATPLDVERVSFTVTLRDGVTEEVLGADAYAQEQSMTTFFRTDGRRTVDCWAVRMASFRTDHILAVRRHDSCTRTDRTWAEHDELVTEP